MILGQKPEEAKPEVVNLCFSRYFRPKQLRVNLYLFTVLTAGVNFSLGLKSVEVKLYLFDVQYFGKNLPVC